MSIARKIKQRATRRALRVRNHIKQTTTPRTRISVFRSLQHIYAQVIDDVAGTTLVSCSSLELKKLEGDKKAIARSVGIELAGRAKDKGIVDGVVFDRGSYLYHGRVKALADGLREGGLKI